MRVGTGTKTDNFHQNFSIGVLELFSTEVGKVQV
jgi:hypothetical protein